MGEIHMIAVDPEHQGKGIGTALTEHAVGRMPTMQSSGRSEHHALGFGVGLSPQRDQAPGTSGHARTAP